MGNWFRNVLLATSIVYFFLALLLPLTSIGPVLEGSDYWRLEHDPLVAALCFAFLVGVALFGRTLEAKCAGEPRRLVVAISVLLLIFWGFVIFRGHIASAVIIIFMSPKYRLARESTT